MNIYLGESGLNESFQKPFPKTVGCHKCGGMARIMFVVAEGTREEKYISELHENHKDKYWPHDACAVAIYLCEGCFEPNALINQA